MSRILSIPLIAATFLLAPAFTPAPLPSLSGSAQAVTNLNTSRSNIVRTKARKTLQRRRKRRRREGTRDDGQKLQIQHQRPHDDGQIVKVQYQRPDGRGRGWWTRGESHDRQIK